MPRVIRGLPLTCLLLTAVATAAVSAEPAVDDVPTIRLPASLAPGAAAPSVEVDSAPASVGASGAPCSGPAYRAFDFWIGTWEVVDADGRRVGDNRIVPDQEGCLLIESWRSANGVTGRSFSFYDAERSVWRQIWISPGSRIEIAGNLLGAHMVLEGKIHYLRTGEVRDFRGTWAPLPDGRVRQYLEESTRDGSWATWFEGFYRRVP